MNIKIKKNHNNSLNPCSSPRNKKSSKKHFPEKTNRSFVSSLTSSKSKRTAILESELFQLCKTSASKFATKDVVISDIERIFKSDPTLVHSLDFQKGFNSLHYVLLNPSLASHIKLIKVFVETSISVRDNEMKKLKTTKNKSENHTKVVPVLSHQSTLDGLQPLHVACQNPSASNIDVFEYIIENYPPATFTQDTIGLNLPLHYLCMACTEVSVPLEFVILLVQKWPDSCKVRNRDGNLPLHLATRRTFESRKYCQRSQSEDEDFFELNDIDTLADLYLDDSETHDDDSQNVEDYGKESTFTFPSGSASSRSRLLVTSQRHSQKDHPVSERYRNQLDIVQYLVAMFPESVNLINNQGQTPLEFAMPTSSTTCNCKTRKDPKGKREDENSCECSKTNLVCSFLRKVTNVPISGGDNISTKSAQIKEPPAKCFIDVSGHEFDEEKYSHVPWKKSISYDGLMSLQRKGTFGVINSIGNGSCKSPLRCSLQSKANFDWNVGIFKTNTNQKRCSSSGIRSIMPSVANGSRILDQRESIALNQRDRIATGRRGSLHSGRRGSLTSGRRGSIGSSERYEIAISERGSDASDHRGSLHSGRRGSIASGRRGSINSSQITGAASVHVGSLAPSRRGSLASGFRSRLGSDPLADAMNALDEASSHSIKFEFDRIPLQSDLTFDMSKALNFSNISFDYVHEETESHISQKSTSDNCLESCHDELFNQNRHNPIPRNSWRTYQDNSIGSDHEGYC